MHFMNDVNVKNKKLYKRLYDKLCIKSVILNLNCTHLESHIYVL